MLKYFLTSSKLVFLVLIITFLSIAKVSNSQILDPDYFHGFRTKWLIDPNLPVSGTSRHSIIPQLSGLSVAEFMKYLESTGANSATINLEARNGMKYTTPVHDTYNLTPIQINDFEYSCGQRNIILTDFLIDVQKAIDEGKIAGTIKFHVHQRLYPQKDENKEDELIKDFSNFINLAKARGVDHLIAGIRLGEHGTDGRGYLLNLALKVAKEVNTNTNGWLKNKGGLEWSGDNYGCLFKNIQKQSASATFFDEISKNTGYFAFCFKAFGLKQDLKSWGYDPDNIDDWHAYFDEKLGFSDLKTFINNYKVLYPLHANVIYVGDSGDALKQVGNEEYNVTTELIQGVGEGFKGIVAVNGYRRPDKDPADDYLYCLDALDNKRPPAEMNKSIYRWQAWPMNDGNVTNDVLVIAKGSIGGIVTPCGPEFLKAGASMQFSFIPEPGFEIENVYVNDVAKGAVNQLTVNDIQSAQTVLVKFRNSEGKLFSHPFDSVLAGTWRNSNGNKYLHFYENGRCTESDTQNSEQTDLGVWWYDFPDNGGSSGYGKGQLIQMSNDDFKLLELAFVENEKQLKVTYPDGNEHIYLSNAIVLSNHNEEATLKELAVVYPNPITSSSIMKFNKKPVNRYEVEMYNSNGQLIDKIITKENEIVIGNRILSKGLNYYLISDNNKLVGYGKLLR